MKQLVAASANLRLSEMNDNKLTALAELVLIVTEPKYKLEVQGFSKSNIIDDIRVEVSVQGIVQLIKSLGELQDDMTELESRASLLKSD